MPEQSLLERFHDGCAPKLLSSRAQAARRSERPESRACPERASGESNGDLRFFQGPQTDRRFLDSHPSGYSLEMTDWFLWAKP